MSHKSGPTSTGELSNPSLGVAIGAQGENDGEGPPFGAGVDEGEAATAAVRVGCSTGPVDAATAPQAARDSTSPAAVMRTLAATNWHPRC